MAGPVTDIATAQIVAHGSSITWSRCVTVSTLASESGDCGSDPRGTSCSHAPASALVHRTRVCGWRGGVLCHVRQTCATWLRWYLTRATPNETLHCDPPLQPSAVCKRTLWFVILGRRGGRRPLSRWKWKRLHPLLAAPSTPPGIGAPPNGRPRRLRLFRNPDIPWTVPSCPEGGD